MLFAPVLSSPIRSDSSTVLNASIASYKVQYLTASIGIRATKTLVSMSAYSISSQFLFK